MTQSQRVAPRIAERDHEGILRCLLCGRPTGYDAFKMRGHSACNCWPHEVSNRLVEEAMTNE